MKTRKIENVNIGVMISYIKSHIAIAMLDSLADFPKEGIQLDYGEIDLDSELIGQFNHGLQDIVKWLNNLGYMVVLVSSEHTVKKISGFYSYPIKTCIKNPELSIKIYRR